MEDQARPTLETEQSERPLNSYCPRRHRTASPRFWR